MQQLMHKLMELNYIEWHKRDEQNDYILNLMLVNMLLFVVNLSNGVDHGFFLQDEQVLNAFAWDSWYNING